MLNVFHAQFLNRSQVHPSHHQPRRKCVSVPVPHVAVEPARVLAYLLEHSLGSLDSFRMAGLDQHAHEFLQVAKEEFLGEVVAVRPRETAMESTDPSSLRAQPVSSPVSRATCSSASTTRMGSPEARARSSIRMLGSFRQVGRRPHHSWARRSRTACS
jgi:hypothetical protein